MAVKRPTEPQMVITVDWDPRVKKWLVDVSYRSSGRLSRGHNWCYAESTVELDQVGATRLMRAVQREIERWLL